MGSDRPAMDDVLNPEDPEEWLNETKKQRFESFSSHDVVGEHCSACQYDPDPVIKRGSLDANLLVVGSFPSPDDFKNKNPLTGPSGQLLDEMLAAIDCSPQEDCYITNSLLCGGPEDRPVDQSVDACRVNVNRQIELVSPEVVLGLGKYAFCSLFHEPVTIDFQENLGHQGVLPDHPWLEAVVSIHPGMIVNQKEGSQEHTRLKRLAWKHLQKVEDLLGESTTQSETDSTGENSSSNE